MYAAICFVCKKKMFKLEKLFTQAYIEDQSPVRMTRVSSVGNRCGEVAACANPGIAGDVKLVAIGLNHATTAKFSMGLEEEAFR